MDKEAIANYVISTATSRHLSYTMEATGQITTITFRQLTFCIYNATLSIYHTSEYQFTNSALRIYESDGTVIFDDGESRFVWVPIDTSEIELKETTYVKETDGGQPES